ncbi:MAG: MaoC family dehydratase [Glaciimonas sp.]|nr:MaoC family dehydratase [Glaciimonas sp.]
MPIIEFDNLAQLRPLIGTEVAVGEWLEVSQQRIKLFAEATGDQQWIHTDEARAAAESPYGSTIAHGFLTLSLIPHLMAQTLRVHGARLSVNYGLNRVRFTAPVRAGKRIRARVTPLKIEDIPGGTQVTWKVVLEIEGSDKPACVAEMIGRRYE